MNPELQENLDHLDPQDHEVYKEKEVKEERLDPLVN